MFPFTKKTPPSTGPAINLHQDFPRGVAGVWTGTGPLAQFMPTELIRNTPSLQHRPGDYFLGVVDGEVTTHRAPNGRLLRRVTGGTPIGYITDKHILTIAPTRSDKGRAAVNPNLLRYPGSMLATSAKSDLIRETLRHRSEALGQTCRFIAPFDDLPEFEPYRAVFNPLTLLNPDSPTLVEDADLIADALIVPGEDKEMHWSEKARTYAGRGLILHVATHPRYEGRRDLVTVYELLLGRCEELEEEMLGNDAAGGAVMDTACDYYETPDNERGSVLSTARRHLAFLAYPQVQRALRGEPARVLNLADLKRTRMTLYICLPAMRLATCGRLFRLLTQLTLAALEREPAKPEFPVRLVLDEFAAFDRMVTVEKAVGQIAGLNCQLHIVLQDLAQLQAIYDKRAESFLANAGLIQTFACADNTTLQWLEARLGQTTVLTPQFSGVSPEAKGDFEATSWQPHTQPLMTAEELSRFFGHQDELLRQLVIVPGLAPLVLQRAYYDQHELFVRR